MRIEDIVGKGIGRRKGLMEFQICSEGVRVMDERLRLITEMTMQ